MKKLTAFIFIIVLGIIFLSSTNIMADTTQHISHALKDVGSNNTIDTTEGENNLTDNFKLEDNKYTFTIPYGDLEGNKVKGACGDSICSKVYYLGQQKGSKQFYISYDTNRYLYADIFQDHEHNDIISINLELYVYDETNNVLIPSETMNEEIDLNYLESYIHSTATLPTNEFKTINMDKINELNKQVTFEYTPNPLTEEAKGGPVNLIPYEDFVSNYTSSIPV